MLAGWLDQAAKDRQRLLDLLAAVFRYRIPQPRGTQESLVEYERRRSVKEMLLEQIIEACVETGDAVRLIRVVMDHPAASEGQEPGKSRPRGAKAMLRGDPAGVRKVWPRPIAPAAGSPCSTWPWTAAASRNASSLRAACRR